MKYFLLILIGILFFSCESDQRFKPSVSVEGELKQWHKVTLVLKGPETSEWARENPFLDYRLEATFTKGNKSLTVPGFFAADGNAGETSAEQGSVWKVHFRPDEIGTWNYKISFRKGKNIVVINDERGSEAMDLDGQEGTIEIVSSDKTGDDFRSMGRIINGGKGYLKFQGSEKLWIKNGADSPENFLAYHEFDQTHRFTLKNLYAKEKPIPKTAYIPINRILPIGTREILPGKAGKGKVLSGL